MIPGCASGENALVTCKIQDFILARLRVDQGNGLFIEGQFKGVGVELVLRSLAPRADCLYLTLAYGADEDEL